MPGGPRRFDDLFQFFGSVAIRRMFGGEGIFAGDLMIGLVVSDQLYLKTDETSRAKFVAESCRPFSYKRAGAMHDTSYYAIPDRLLDDPEEFAEWARLAHRVAQAAGAKKERKKPKRP